MPRRRSGFWQVIPHTCQKLLRAEHGMQNIAAIAVAPILLLFVFTIVQAAAFWNAANAAHSIATIAYEAQRVHESPPGAGQAAASQYLPQLATTLTDVDVDVTSGATTASVTVTGNAPSIVPGWNLQISETVTGPVERWTE